jgi:ATP-dependent DNA helicase RecG
LRRSHGQTLNAIVKKGESETVEFKKSTGQRTEAARTLCGMMNAAGGRVFFGVTSDGRTVGQNVSDVTLQDLANEFRKFEPAQFPKIETISLSNSVQVICVCVEKSDSVVMYDGRAYIRIGPTTSVMSRSVLAHKIIASRDSNYRWESTSSNTIRFDDLSEAEIIATMEEAIRRHRVADPGLRSPEAILTGLGVLKNKEFAHAAMVLFGKSDRLLPYYPQCLLRMARFRGNDKSEFLDNRQEFGNIFDLFLRAQRFLMDHLPIAGKIIPKITERQDDPLIPSMALREALANAFCHRDYSGGAVSVAIYDNRLEISNPGTLPPGLRLTDLVGPHVSKPPNPLIANVLYRRGIIESWGRGTNKIVELVSGAGLVEPRFILRAGEFVVQFSFERSVAHLRPVVSETSLDGQILNFLRTNPKVNLADLAKALDSPVPFRTLQNHLRILKEQGVIETMGRGRGATWRIKNE